MKWINLCNMLLYLKWDYDCKSSVVEDFTENKLSLGLICLSQRDNNYTSLLQQTPL